MITAHTIYFKRIFIVFTVFLLFSCQQQAINNNNNSTNPTLQSQVVGNWKLVKEHWHGNVMWEDTILTSWSTSSGSTVTPTIEFGNEVLTQWYSGGMDNMSWGGPCFNPFQRGSSGVPSLWAIEASTNRLLGGAHAKYKFVYIDANNMILSQENFFGDQNYFDTLWLERY